MVIADLKKSPVHISEVHDCILESVLGHMSFLIDPKCWREDRIFFSSLTIAY